MNKLKSIFIGIYLMLATTVSVFAIYQLSMFPFSNIWFGTLLISLPIPLFITKIMIFENVARTSAHFPILTLITLSGLVLVINEAFNIGYEVLSYREGSALLVPLICFVMFLLYNFWYSKLTRKISSQLQKYQTLPSFHITNLNGVRVNSADFKGVPTVLIFFRGNWCPLCMAQVKEIAGYYRQISALGAKVVLISPQPEKMTQALAAKFDVDFHFMTDSNNEAAKSLDIEMENGLPMGMEILGYQQDTVYPTVIITNKDGEIIYSDLTNNYRIRPEPAEFIKVLSQ